VLQLRTSVRTHRWVGDAVIPSAALEAGSARCLARLHATEEGLVRALDAQDDVLQDLTAHLATLRHRLLDAR
jgi:hypothetical protein